MMAVRQNLTDRAYRYRANRSIPAGPKVCTYCGSRKQLQVEHINGKEQDSSPENLTWACRSCNQRKSNVMRKAGMGRLTHQYNPSGGAKTLAQWLNAVSVITPHKDRGQGSLFPTADNKMSVADAVAMIRATPASRRSAFAREIAGYKRMRARSNPRRKKNLWPFDRKARRPEQRTPASGGIAAHSGKGSRTSLAPSPKGKVSTYKGHRITTSGEGFKALDSEFDSLRDAKRFIDVWTKRGNPGKRKKRRNPADASAAAFQEFHGRPSEEVVTVSQRVHTHEHLASAGKLKLLKVDGVDGKHHEIKNFGGALLAFNERKNQLFVRGGDQSINLSDYGIKDPHEVETLGQVTHIDYLADKHHLRDEGGKGVYRHKFRTTNEDGQHVTVKIARYPDLIYRVLDKQLEFSGGSYEIRAEGIDR